jgi:SAM-dependent methyltransferase
MPQKQKKGMETRELGLVLGQQLLGVEDLHYGLWDQDLAPTLTNLPAAQRRYTEFLLGRLRQHVAPPARVLDVGCGTGKLLLELNGLGYEAEGVSPAPGLTRLGRARLDAAGRNDVRIFECRFEDFPCAERARHYDALMFSESFQYISVRTTLELAGKILRPGGHLVICDFFRTARDGDGGSGDGTFGGGHPIGAFYETVRESRFDIVSDEELTDRIAPTLAIADEILMRRILPACDTIARYMDQRRPWLFRALRLIWRRKAENARRKYFSGHRTPQTFSRYKTYRMIVCRLAR